MFTLKQGVKVNGLKPEMVFAIIVLHDILSEMGKEFTITSCCDGKHSVGSLHYKGLAIDVRTRHLNITEQRELQEKSSIRLGRDYDCVLESDHLHVEFDAKS